MPAKKQITKEAIISAALESVREVGMENLNMRAIAKRCKCSTQPIYLSFSGMDELKDELSKKIQETFDGYIASEISSGEYPVYKATGMGYIRFAKEEKELFKYLFMRKRENVAGTEKSTYDSSVMVLIKNYGLYKDDAVKLHAEMWIFVHGIATMFATGYLDWDWETVSSMVTDAFNGLSARLSGANGDKK